jgi:hypothetical protein
MQHPMGKPLLKALIEHHTRTATDLERIVPNCTTCENMSNAQCCSVNGDQRIPTEFQGIGCDAWTYDCIPF